MSRLKIRLRLPTESHEFPTTAAQSSPLQIVADINSANVASPTHQPPLPSAASTSLSSPILASPSLAPTTKTAANFRAAPEGEDEDASMADSPDDGGESEDELLSDGDGDAPENDSSSNLGRSASAAFKKSGEGQRVASGSPSSGLTAAQRAKKRTARMLELEKMTAEEIDALPPAKRRQGAKARGASGPGRGWRKGLKMGDKPRYTLPDLTPVAEGTPSSFAESSRASPLSAMSGSPEPSTKTVTAGAANATSTKRAGPGGLSLTAQAALAGKSILPSGRAPQAVAAAMAFGPPVKPPPKVINLFPATLPPLNKDVEQKPRKWQRDVREWINLAGRVCRVTCWWGGEDRGFDPEQEREKEEAARADTPGTGPTTPAGVSVKGKQGFTLADGVGSPNISHTSTPKPGEDGPMTAQSPPPTGTGRGRGGSLASRGGPGSRGGRGGRCRGSAATGKRFSSFISSSRRATDSAALPNASKSTISNAAAASSLRASSGKTGATTHLPKPKFQPGGGAASANWKGSSSLGGSSRK